MESTITNRFSVTSVTKANEELTEDSNRKVESEKSSLSSNNEESEEVAILKPVETTDDSFIKPKVSKLSNRFSVKSVTEEKTEKPQPKSSIASRFSIKSVSKDDSTSKTTEVEQGLMDKPEPHLSQSRFVVKSVKETEEQVPYETDNDSVFTDDQPAENADLEVIVFVESILQSFRLWKKFQNRQYSQAKFRMFQFPVSNLFHSFRTNQLALL